MNDSGDRDPREVFLRLWAYRRWIAGCIVVFTLAFGLSAAVITPEYRATAVLAPASSGRSNLSGTLSSTLGQLGGIGSMIGLNVGGADTGTEEAIAVLCSRQFTERFISDQRLLPVLFSALWDKSSGHWNVPAQNQPTMGKAFKLFNESIRSITQDKKTGLVTLQIDWRDPVAAADWANQLVARLNHEMRSRALAESAQSLVFLDGELSKTNDLGTRAAINRLVEMQIQERMLANVTEEFAFRIVDRATPPDKWDTVRPRKLLLILSGLMSGLVFGVLSAALRSSFVSRGGVTNS